MQNRAHLPDVLPPAYVARNKDAVIRSESTSGGLFTVFANKILENGGVVFGAALDEHLEVVHQQVTTVEQLAKLRTSKYVQSQIGPCYFQAKTYLEAGTAVFFTGTPCQIGGLYAYLGKEYPRLLTQDLICHGVPSAKVWRKYLENRGANRQIETINFRDKITGWKDSSLSVRFKDGSCYHKPIDEDAFTKAFLYNLCLRPSCHSCPYKTISRQADITLADAWGIAHFAPLLDDDGGTSLVLFHSKKAEAIWDACSDLVLAQKVDAADALKYNPSCIQSVTPHCNRDKFMGQINSISLEEAVQNCCHPSLVQRIIGRIRYTTKGGFRFATQTN